MFSVGKGVGVRGVSPEISQTPTSSPVTKGLHRPTADYGSKNRTGFRETTRKEVLQAVLLFFCTAIHEWNVCCTETCHKHESFLTERHMAEFDLSES